MGRMKLYTGYKVLLLIIVFALLIVSLMCYIPVNGLTKAEIAGYKGKYNYKADHEIWNPMSPDFSSKATESYKSGVLQNCYQSFIGWGMTPEGAAGVVANIAFESGGIPQICWGYERSTANYGWTEYINGYDGDVGIGLIEFTYYTAVYELWDKAAELGVKWTDLGAQLSYLKDGYGFGPSFKSKEIKFVKSNGNLTYKTVGDVFYSKGVTAKDAAESFCRAFEVPAHMDPWVDEKGVSHKGACAERGEMAQELLGKYQNLSGIDSSTLVGAKDPSATATGSIIDLGGLVDEWDLVGMPKKSGLADKAIIPTLPDYSNLSSAEQYSIGVIRDHMKEESAFNAWNTARQVVVFVGLLLLTYTVLLALAMIFDSVNVFFDFSLVRFLTLGVLNYHPDLSDIDATMVKKGKLISKKKMIVLLIVFLGISLLFIGGGVLSGVLKAVYWLVDLFGGNIG